jgi:hypothetical protein
MSAYDYQLCRREVEAGVADTFEAEFSMVTGRPVETLSRGESPDRIVMIDAFDGKAASFARERGSDQKWMNPTHKS